MLLRAANLARAFPHRRLFERVSLSIDDGERIGLIGANGSGKSTLLRILAGLEAPDGGEIVRRRGLRTVLVPQLDAFPENATALSALEDALAALGFDETDRHVRAAEQIGHLALADPETPVAALSGGWRKRLAIAAALAADPELLLLDEPTNHLDLDGVAWLEETLRRASFASIFVTHDRFFLERVCTRIVELGHAYPDGTISVPGGYDEFLRRRDEFLAGQRKEQESLANRVREDIAWLSRGAKARRTKAKSRIQDAAERRDQLTTLQSRNAETDRAGLEFQATARQTRKLLVARGVAKAVPAADGPRTLFANLELELGPGDCVGLVGVNGSGKTTLIRLLSDDLAPDAGTIDRAEKLRTVVFTQHRATLDPKRTLHETLVPVGDTVHHQGRAMHVVTWARRFLFSPEQLPSPVGLLSGGEQARAVIARLMLEPADLLILDEPTNDLDIATLEVLEHALEEFPGAIVLVTHDRFMLERLATELVWLDGRGNAPHFADFAQWDAARRRADADDAARTRAARPAATPAANAAAASTPKRRKLSYKDQREWDGMEAAIHAAEARAKALEAQMADPAVMADHARMHAVCADLDAAHAEVERLFARWAELEALGGA